MTLQDLRDAVQRLLDEGVAPETSVLADGCDCIGPGHELVWDAGHGAVVLARADGGYRRDARVYAALSAEDDGDLVLG